MDKIYLGRLNEIQKKFVYYCDNTNILVSASAGTGKTTSMIAKIMYLIDEKGVSIKNLLVVTYTTSAANEMKQKLFKLLTQTINMETDIEKKNRLCEELDNINQADIGTIDAICKKYITKYFYELGIDPKFAIVEKEQAYLLNQAIQQAFNFYISNNDRDFYNLFECFNSKRETEDLKNIVEKIYNFFQSKENIESWIQNILNKSYDINLDSNICAKYLFNKNQSLLMNFEKDFIFLKDRSEVLDLEKCVPFFTNIIGFFNAIKHSEDYYDFAKTLTSYEFVSKPRRNKNADIVEEEWWDALDEKLGSFRKAMEDATKNIIFDRKENIVDGLKFIKRNVDKLIEVVKRVEDNYSQIKAQRKSLDFTDLEKFTLKLFNNQNIKKEIQDTYKYVFVDEYQDVNGLQESIITQISNGNNLIMIGDVKQSIYEFRLSQPQNFIDKYNDKINNKIFDFTENYRSENNILQFVNNIFEKLITNDTIGIDYKNSRLECGGKVLKNKCVELSILNSKEEDENENLKSIDKIIRYEREADLAIKKINELRKIVNPQTNTLEYEYRDIAILTRKKGDAIRILYNKLQKNNIPVSVEFNKNLFDNSEIIFLMSFLRLLNNYQDDISLASVLKSFVYNFSDDDLAEIRSFSDGKFYANCKLYKGDLENKLALFWRDIEFYRDYLNDHKIYECLEKFIEDKEILTYYKSLPDGLEKEGNIKEFIMFSSNKAYEFSLQKFLDYIIAMNDKNQVLKVKVSENCVKIMTMHSSKGLDYKACILVDLASKFNLGNREKNLFVSDKFGFGLRYQDLENRIDYSSIPLLACKSMNIKTQIDEEIRLLYVALTRAKKYMYLIASYPIDKISSFKKDDLYSKRSFLELLFYSFNEFDLKDVCAKNGGIVFGDTDGELIINIDNIEDANCTKTSNSIVFSGAEQDIVNELNKYYSYVYPYNSSSNVSYKNSVTGIMHEELCFDNPAYDINKINLFDFKNEDNLSVQIGNAYHLIMQHLTYKETFDEVKLIIDKLIKSGNISKELINFIDCDRIFNAKEIIGKMIAGEIYKEQKFMLQVPFNKIIENANSEDDVLIQGIVDLIVKTENGYVIIDFKTNKNTTEKSLVEKYYTQLVIYSMAVEQALDVKIHKKYLYSFDLCKLIEIF